MQVPRPVAAARLRPPRVRGVRRPRLDALLDGAWDHRVSLVVAPAGSGKTTAVAALVARSSHPFVWLAANGCDGTAGHLLAYLAAAFAPHLGGDGMPDWRDVDDALDALERLTAPVGLAVDDVHALGGTEAEAVLDALLRDLPPTVHVVLAGRRVPALDLAHLRLAGDVLEVSSDELRFRSWEAEQLFRDEYKTWLGPADVARLTRRLEGWAAGLQLFHLAAQHRSPAEQRRLVDRLGGHARLMREYLATNVLAALDPEVRTFLVDTAVLGVFTPALADRLRGTDDASRLVRTLEEAQVFTVALDDDTYRYHEVLRAHLEVLLLERDGADAVVQRNRCAGQLLEDAGFHAEALRCFVHAGDHDAVRRVLGTAEDAPWFAELPPALVVDDPWILRARARAERRAGRVDAAVATYREAEARATGSELAARCRAERTDLRAWHEPLAQPLDGWARTARAGLRREPVVAAVELERHTDPLAVAAAGALRLLAGDHPGAAASFERVLRGHDDAPVAVSMAAVGAAVTSLLQSDDDGAPALDDAEMLAERLGVGWAARLARAALALTGRPGGTDEARHVRTLCDHDGDGWGAAFATLLAGLGERTCDPDRADAELADAAARFQALDAPLGVACARQARSDQPVNAPARPTTDPVVAFAAAEPQRADAGRATGLRVVCFGRFAVQVGDADVPLGGLRPRVRALLQLLALHAGATVHREVLVDALWPDTDATAGLRNLQVAVSSLRRALTDAGVGEHEGVVRDGDGYRLCVEDTATASDVGRFTTAVADARSALARVDAVAAGDAAHRAAGAHRAELLVEAGPAEWVVPHRTRYEAQLTSVVAGAASLLLDGGDTARVIDLCEQVVAVTPYADEIWRLLERAHVARDDLAAAVHVRNRYHAVTGSVQAMSTVAAVPTS